jgi:hypothetical protein
MPEKLTEKNWKEQLKKHKDVTDTGISEPLRDYEKYAEKDYPKALAALKKLAAKIDATKKKFNKNTELLKHLSAMAFEAQDEQESLEKQLRGEDAEEGADKELNQVLKKARTGEMYFAVVVKSATEGKLLLAHAKVPATAVAEAKKSLGGGQELRGLCVGEEGTHVFYFRKAPPGILAQLLKSIAKIDAGLTINVECRVKADLADVGDEDDIVAKSGDAPSRPKTAPPPIQAFQSASLKWTQAKTTAEKSVEALQSALLNSGDALAAAVAHGLVRVLGQLPDVGFSLERLADAAKGGQPGAVQDATVAARHKIAECITYVSQDPLVAIVESNPFVKVDLKKALATVLVETTRTCPTLK